MSASKFWKIKFFGICDENLWNKPVMEIKLQQYITWQNSNYWNCWFWIILHLSKQWFFQAPLNVCSFIHLKHIFIWSLFDLKKWITFKLWNMHCLNNNMRKIKEVFYSNLQICFSHKWRIIFVKHFACKTCPKKDLVTGFNLIDTFQFS